MNSVDVAARPDRSSIGDNQLGSLKDLVGDIDAGKVDALFILGGNPAYSSPADFEFLQHLAKVKRSIYLSSHLDETAALCTWHIPQAHFLESWGDAQQFRWHGFAAYSR